MITEKNYSNVQVTKPIGSLDSGDKNHPEPEGHF